VCERHRGQRGSLQGVRGGVTVDRHVPQPVYRLQAAGKIIKESVRTGKSIRQIVLAKKLMTADELDRALDVESMTRGGIIH
jgi:aspartate ammonia-lyase